MQLLGRAHVVDDLIEVLEVHLVVFVEVRPPHHVLQFAVVDNLAHLFADLLQILQLDVPVQRVEQRKQLLQALFFLDVLLLHCHQIQELFEAYFPVPVLLSLVD